MVLTRNSCISENFRASKKILRDIKHQQQLRPRVSNPDYREESPDEISYFRNILKVDVKNKKSLSHKLRIRTDNTKKTYKEIHRYELRTTSTDDSKCDINHNMDCTVASVHESEHNNDNNRKDHISVSKDDRVTITHPISINQAPEIHENTASKTSIFGVNKCKRTFKRRLSGSFKKHSDLDNSQICYDDGRRYPVRLRRRPTEVYMVNKSGKKPNWHESLSSPIQNCYESSRHKKLELYTKQSDTDDSDDLLNDEIRFENRKQRSMQRARLELNPINMSSKDISTMDLFKERSLARSSLADIEPMAIDKTITFDMVGGNKGCIQALKESVVLPLVYPEVFEKLGISPPRGILFYGAPGSGKTLMARALVNECSNSGTCKISFFMRKGADCLSKWVGESERQLRLLFDQAYKMRPSIIFFDEIDGLAPVRSARQDQIHSSIVSTILSLIDGLDDRGQIIVIGATNRLDAIDPALRRPGRFDREFLFTLPEEEVRKDILMIHTKNWRNPLNDSLVNDLASVTKGYSGADLKGLVIEAGLCALRRRYPQIYRSQKKLQLNIKEIYVKEEDFKAALRIVRPSSERSGFPVHSKIPPRIQVLIDHQYLLLKSKIAHLFQEPVFSKDSLTSVASPRTGSNLFKLRLHVSGYEVDNVVSGLFHDIHNVNISSMDSLYLGTNNGLSVEEKVTHLFREAHKSPNSLIYLPHLDITFQSMSLAAQNMLVSMIQGTIPNSDFNITNVLVLVTLSQGVDGSRGWSKVEFEHTQSDAIWQQLGQCFQQTTVTIDRPSFHQRIQYFSQLIEKATKPSRVEGDMCRDSEPPVEEVLKEVEIKPVSLTKVELDKLELEEDNILRKFRMLLRKILANLAKDRKFQIFHNPVDVSEVPDYYSIVTNPMDLSTMRQKVDMYNYYTFDELKSDLNLISANALLYNPPKNSYLKDIRRHAYEFNDIADSIFEEHLNPEFAKMVSEIHQSRMKRCYYEKKKQSLAQQPGDILDFLEDLNGTKYEVMNGPLLKSQIEMYHTFYSKAARKTKADPRAHSDSETVVTRTSLNDSIKCRSLCDMSDANQSNEVIKKTLESFKNLSRRSGLLEHSTDLAEEAAAEEVADDDDKEHKTKKTEESAHPQEVSVVPVLIDSEELSIAIRYIATKVDKWTLFQMESLYWLLYSEIDKYDLVTDRSGLPKALRNVTDSYCSLVT